MNIQSTKEYSKFKQLKGNRDVSIGQVKFLVSSILKKNLLAEHPIIVNEKWEIIDGQHRLEAAKMLDIPIFYATSSGATIQDTQILNYAARVWSSKEFLRSLSDNGNAEAKFIREFVEKNKVPVTVALQISTSNKDVLPHMLMKQMQAGEYVADARDSAELYAQMLATYRSYATDRAVRDSNLARAVRRMFEKKLGDHVTMIEQLAIYPHGIDRQIDEKEYIRLFEEIYNYNRKSGKVRFF